MSDISDFITNLTRSREVKFDMSLLCVIRFHLVLSGISDVSEATNLFFVLFGVFGTKCSLRVNYQAVRINHLPADFTNSIFTKFYHC